MGNDVSKKNSYEIELSKSKGVRVKTLLRTEKTNVKAEHQGKIKTTRTKCWTFGFTLLGLMFLLNIVVAVIMWGTNLYYDSILQIVTFSEGGMIFNLWKGMSVPRVISVYPFNYTNTIDIKKKNHVPHVEQIGPFVFREKVERVNVNFHNNGTLTYQENRTQIYVPELSNGSLSDTIILPNFPVLAAHNMEDSNMLERSGVSFLKMVSMPKDFLTATINDIIWGHDDRFTRVTTALKSIFSQNNDRKFGILALRSGLSPDRVTIGTGIPKIENFAVISRYNGRSTIGAWNDEQCDKIEGTDGTIFPASSVVPNTTLYAYAKEVCRKLPMIYEKDVISHNVPAYRYRMPGNIFDCAEKNPANKCYCRKSVCPPCGTFNTAPCNSRLPVLISYPHFTHADPILREKVTGLTPDPEKYQTFVDVLKNYGITLNGVTRIQINFFLNQSSNHPWLNLANGTVLPLAWIEMKNGEFSFFLKFLFFNLSYTVPIIEVSFRYGSLLMIFALPYIMYIMLRSGYAESVPPDN